MSQPDAPILVVEDHADTRDLLRTRLEADGYFVVEAEDGKVALDYLMSEGQLEPCLIVLDLEMPVMPGWELLAIIKGYQRLAQIPVIIVSGARPPLEHVEAIAHHAIVATIPKPYQLNKLVETVRKFARKHCG